jgi:EmrB/QacA subfamily drug resistance transporter
MTSTSTTATTPATSEAPNETTYDPRRWAGLAAVLCATLLGVLDFLIVNIAVPHIRSGLRATSADIQLTVAGYGLAYAVCLITGGRLGDIYGRKKMFLWGMAGFTFASMLCGLAQTPLQLVAARVLQGLLASAMTPQVLSIIQVSFPPREKGLAFAIMGAVVGIGSFIGNVFGGWLVDANVFGLGWRPIFFVNLPIGLCAMMAAWFLIRESKAPTATRLDGGGVLLSGLGLFCLIFPLSEGRERGWPLWAFGMLALSAVILWFFVRFEKLVKARGGAPLVDMELFHDRAFSAGLGAVMALFAAMGSFALTLTLFLQSGFGVSAAQTGVIFAPLPVAFLAASLWTVKLAQKIGPRILLVGMGLMLLAQSLMFIWIVLHGAALNPFTLMPIMLVYGVAQGTTVPRLMGTVLSNVAHDNAGAASGVLTTTQQVAFAIGISVIGGLFFSSLGARADAAAAATYVRAFSLVLACNFVLQIVTFVLLARLTQIPAASLSHEIAPMEA